MKAFTITGGRDRVINFTGGTDFTVSGTDDMQCSDGYHTFDELYNHRIQLWITLCQIVANDERFPLRVWKSKKHSDGSAFDGWFLLGIGTQQGDQMTYHVPMNRWDDTAFAETLVQAPSFDGHTPADVLERLRTI